MTLQEMEAQRVPRPRSRVTEQHCVTVGWTCLSECGTKLLSALLGKVMAVSSR